MALSILNEEENAIRDAILALVKDTIAPKSQAFDRSAVFPRENMEMLGRQGYLGMIVDPKWGGAGASYLAQTLVVEAIAAADPATAVIYEVHNSLHIEGIWRFGTDEQRARFLPALCQGDAIGAFAITEAESGSNAAAMRTRAVKSGSEYRLNGRKVFITSAGEADWYIVFATVDPTLGEKGITAFLVPKDAPGLHFGPPEDKLGIRASRTSEVILDDVRVPEENRLGQEGQGYSMALFLLDGGRIGIAAQSVGIMSTALERSLAYAREREQFGRPIGQFEGVQWRLADMATDLHAARLMTYEAAHRREEGPAQRPLFAMAKLFASEKAVQHAADAIQIFGGYGYMREYGVERLLRDAKVTEIYEGTSEIMRLVIASRLLKEYDLGNI
ncbi:MAG: acyl-CoA dehydrogenase [Sulfobacillus thermosulfidooxidans]|uniref:Acyl-CoA dehydrogenase n=1 Tax=Sulfobacillus thermotolerans TaxID=338644 RepID=A0ABM6RQ19_9FIRM|nr:acyl-CoA dehydrogenase family protein [Sulfobacillus sp. hq2]AUW93451.1 acyl-CoA dehydrogenase [Sulfobacillus thermotolerans]MCY0907516.1 acyl-CoA dehydrogenase family protein [Sulfobacillus thermotolerans]POB10691.1 acyl-CoA dehydrogenase [Sulfobacillus sp. hq2]PSR36498.1 MAG: acyl-CoA dehydrogenase [Sulfobacillus thermosulfidooxidans]